MAHSLEYHVLVRPVISPSVAFLSLIAISLFLVPAAGAQINGAPASVTSPGFGGRAINGPPASVTSLGPRGFAPGPQIPLVAATNGFRRGDGHRRHRSDGVAPLLYAYPVPYAVEVPYAVDNGPADDNAADSDAEELGGPTVFDRRGSGASSYVPPVKDVPTPHAADPNDPPADPEPPQAPTVLVFKDGHKLEVGNYAIVGATLFDLTLGHSRRVAIADLDLDATRQQNEDHGVIFQLPPAPQSN